MQSDPNPSESRRRLEPSLRPILGVLLALVLIHGTVIADELAPRSILLGVGADAEPSGRFAEATLALAVEIDRDGAELVAYTAKRRPFVRPLGIDEPRAYEDGRMIQLEVVLLGPDGGRYTQRTDVGPLCFAHGPDAQPHVAGDTIRLHRDSFVVEVPAIDDWNRVELAYYERGQGTALRRAVGLESLEPAKLRPSPRNGSIAASGSDAVSPPQAPDASTALWPEDFDDPDVYRIFGDEGETGERVNIVIVPDGYTYGEKSVMEGHAQAMVDWFRTVTPYKEHDAFINYTLVYAYSVESGADECDCGTVVNTAMGTRFLQAVPNCGDSANRCLYYGGGCDVSGSGNIVLAELRAPAQDETIVMVNTTRYGGCGGARSVYSAANSSATDIAVHELGHSWAGLADEYSYQAGCGSHAGEVNTSLNGTDGAWAEWIDELGAPKEGADYWQSCVFRPQANCEMRSLFQPFCAVCNQHWSLVTFGHWRVQATAPVKSMTPPAATTAWVGIPQEFSVETRLSNGPQIQNQFRWWLTAPGGTFPSLVATDIASHSQIFDSAGTYELEADVVADTNFVKPSRWGANRDIVTWQIEVSPLAAPDEISAPGAVDPLGFTGPGSLAWEDGTDKRAFEYNLYRGDLAGVGGSNYGACHQSGLLSPQTSVVDDPGAGEGWFYLVTGVNPAGEGTLGSDSSGTSRPNSSPCGP